MARPRDQHASGKRWCDHITVLAWSVLGVDPAELPDIVENREASRGPVTLLRGKAGMNINGCFPHVS